MFIRCWGSRGSIPVSGPQYDRYGGDTTCLEIRSEKGDLIVVDAGSGIRLLGDKLAKEGITSVHMLFTHAHFDHMMGLPFFPPIYRIGTKITIHGNPFDQPSYRDILGGLMTAPYCPVEFSRVPATFFFDKLGSRPFNIGSIRVTPIPLSHPNGGLGYRFEEGKRSFVFLTDNELEFTHPSGLNVQAYVDFSKNADLLIHDAEYTQKDYNQTWGHSTYNSAIDLGLAANVKMLGLFHLNQKRTDDQEDAMVEAGRRIIAKQHCDMKCFAVGSNFRVRLK